MVSDAKHKTGYAWHAMFGWQDPGSGPIIASNVKTGVQPITHHICHPDTKRRAAELVEVSGLLKHLHRVDCVKATPEEIMRVHTERHHNWMKEQSDHEGGHIGDHWGKFGAGGYEIGALAAGTTIQMVKAVLEGHIKNGYALVHSPGHHAEPDWGNGMCMFNNVAIAAQWAIDNFKLKRIAIVDIDVHHGNGAERIFYQRRDVLTISVHQHLCYPTNRGYVEDRGEGSGLGYNVNVSLPLGCGNGAYSYLFDSIVIPALREYKPELIIVASGLDPNTMDPLARSCVTVPGFEAITDKLLAVADELCEGKMVFSQEGGYSPVYVPVCVHAVIQRLAGVHILDDPYADIFQKMYGSEMEDHQRTAIDGIRAVVLPLGQ